MTLPVHEEDQQTVIYRDGNAEQAIEDRPTSPLMAYFQETTKSKEMLDNPDLDADELEEKKSEYMAATLKYTDMPKFYRWVGNKNNGRWQRRKRKSDRGQIARIPYRMFGPHTQTHFFMRSLLNVKTGVTSFDDLKTVDGHLCTNYKEACQMMGLYHDDKEWDLVMEEAHQWKFSKALRDLAANIIMYNQPVNPDQFLRRHIEKLTEDYTYHHKGASDEEAFQWLLIEIKTYLEKCEMTLKAVNLPEPIDLPKMPSKAYAHEYNWEQDILSETYETQSELLTEKQQNMFDKVYHSVVNKLGKVYFCVAPGGCGKTFTVNTLMAKLRLEGRVCLACATSGIAANQLDGGTTAHTKFKIPIDLTEDTRCDIREGTNHAKLMKDAELIIWDEATMMNKDGVDAVDRSLRDIRGNDKPFGGITVAFLGDWRQTLPVVPRASKEQKIASTLLYSNMWEHVETIELTDNMRAKLAGGDAEFAQYLLDLGEGKVPTVVINGAEYIKVPDDMVLKTNKLEDLVDCVFSNLTTKYKDTVWLYNRAIICPLNEDVHEVNDMILNKFPGEKQAYFSIDRVLDNDLHANVEVINKLHPQGLPRHKIELKRGCMIMLTRNLNYAEGHCNGTRYVVTNLGKYVIEARIPDGPHKGKVIYIPRIDNRPAKNYSPQISRLQFPIKLAFAMTSNKSQGQTLSQTGICLQSPFFDHGQKYVATSRCGNRNKIKFFIPQSNTGGSQIVQAKDKTDEYFTSNVVFKEIFALSKK